MKEIGKSIKNKCISFLKKTSVALLYTLSGQISLVQSFSMDREANTKSWNLQLKFISTQPSRDKKYSNSCW